MKIIQRQCRHLPVIRRSTSLLGPSPWSTFSVRSLTVPGSSSSCLDGALPVGGHVLIFGQALWHFLCSPWCPDILILFFLLSWTLTRDCSLCSLLCALCYWTNKDLTTASMGVFSNYNLGLYSWLLSSCLHSGHLYMAVNVRTDQWKLHPLGLAMLPEMNSWDQAVSFSFTVKGLPRRARIAVSGNHTALVCLMSRYQNDITGALFCLL